LTLRQGLRRRVDKLISSVYFILACAWKVRPYKREIQLAIYDKRATQAHETKIRGDNSSDCRFTRLPKNSATALPGLRTLCCAAVLRVLQSLRCCNLRAAHLIAGSSALAEGSTNGSQANVPAVSSATDKGEVGSPPKLRGLDSNPQGHFGPQYWQAFRDSVAHI
jgi:hypothetical protein